jgi:putative SOS response-associated peptidase YedK
MVFMCGRFVQALDPQEYADYFGAVEAFSETLKPSYNVAPTKRVYAVASAAGQRQLGVFQWGLVPHWAKDPGIGSRLINARAETLAKKSSFKDSFRRRRCIIPADGFYEWERRESGGKLPHYVFAIDAKPLALAGLWSSWRDADTDDRLTTCTIVTTRPNELVGTIHDRMPVILGSESWEQWLDPEFEDLEGLRLMLVPAAAGSLAEHAVSSLVNNTRNDFAECILPLEGPLSQ